MKTNVFLFALVCGLIGFSACKDDDAPPATTPTPTLEAKDTIIELTSENGTMYLYMYKGTPIHRANFHKLVGEGFYNQTEFHRIIPNFMIQGGDPNSKDNDRTNDGRGGPGYTLPAEIDTSKYRHTLGTVAAARLPDDINPNKESSGSQFYIVVSETGARHLDNNYTVFGHVIQGATIAQDIVKQPRNGNNLPNTRLPMTMKILEKTPEEILNEFGFAVEE